MSSQGEWTVSCENGEGTEAFFDVFIVQATGTKSTPAVEANQVYLYKGLTTYYQTDYPQAGVQTVVVTYILKIALYSNL